LRCSGYDSATLRRTLLDHRPIPALLLDSLEALGGRPALAPAKPSPMARVVARDFPGLSHNARTEIVAQASPTDLKLFQHTERLPLTVAETARLYLRESRICKPWPASIKTAAQSMTRYPGVRHAPTPARLDRQPAHGAARRPAPR
jgi:hypothetical protein